MSQLRPAATQSHPPAIQQQDSDDGPDIYEDASSESGSDEDDQMDEAPAVESAVDRVSKVYSLLQFLELTYPEARAQIDGQENGYPVEQPENTEAQRVSLMDKPFNCIN